MLWRDVSLEDNFVLICRERTLGDLTRPLGTPTHPSDYRKYLSETPETCRLNPGHSISRLPQTTVTQLGTPHLPAPLDAVVSCVKKNILQLGHLTGKVRPTTACQDYEYTKWSRREKNLLLLKNSVFSLLQKAKQNLYASSFF